MKKTYPIVILFIVLSLSACSPSDNNQDGKEKIIQKGTASWYGPGFHGKTTANGDTYDQNELTAASKSLPLGSTAEVTNVETGESVTVEINDRGPYAKGRIIDLSKAAAKEIGIKEDGTGKVKIVAEPPK